MKRLLTLIGIIMSSACAFTLSIDQPSVLLTTAPGATQTFMIKVGNPNENKMGVKIYIQDWVYTPSRGKKFGAPGLNKTSCAQWIKTKQATIVLQPKSTQDVEFTITTPQDAQGGNQAVVFFETDMPEANTANIKSMTTYGLRVGTIVYQETKNAIKRDIEVVDQKTIQTEKQFVYTATIRNQGNACARLKGYASLVEGTDMVEKKELSVGLLPGESYVLKTVFAGKGTAILYVLEDQDALYSGQYIIQAGN